MLKRQRSRREPWPTDFVVSGAGTPNNKLTTESEGEKGVEGGWMTAPLTLAHLPHRGQAAWFLFPRPPLSGGGLQIPPACQPASQPPDQALYFFSRHKPNPPCLGPRGRYPTQPPLPLQRQKAAGPALPKSRSSTFQLVACDSIKSLPLFTGSILSQGRSGLGLPR